jgi:hypothetical protein
MCNETEIKHAEMFQSCFRLHRHVCNYANEKVVLANHRTRSRELRDGGFRVVVDTFIRDPDKQA